MFYMAPYPPFLATTLVAAFSNGCASEPTNDTPTCDNGNCDFRDDLVNDFICDDSAPAEPYFLGTLADFLSFSFQGESDNYVFSLTSGDTDAFVVKIVDKFDYANPSVTVALQPFDSVTKGFLDAAGVIDNIEVEVLCDGSRLAPGYEIVQLEVENESVARLSVDIDCTGVNDDAILIVRVKAADEIGESCIPVELLISVD